MSFYAYDANGYLGDVASIGGWTAFGEWAMPKGGEVLRLIRQGTSTDLARLSDQLSDLYSPDSDVESVRVELLGLVRKAEELLIITEGEG